MPRYIDAEKINLNSGLLYDTDVGDVLIPLVNVQQAIAQAPTEDVKPVKHGNWVADQYMVRSPSAENYRCSLCGGRCRQTKYCPQCGARMDGKEQSNV